MTFSVSVIRKNKNDLTKCFYCITTNNAINFARQSYVPRRLLHDSMARNSLQRRMVEVPREKYRELLLHIKQYHPWSLCVSSPVCTLKYSTCAMLAR